jgi:acetyl esterase/lipase
MTMPGETFLAHGWRIVSVDYRAGADSLADVLNAAGAEATQSTGGLLCVYGESAGAQLALVVAARLSAIDCVVAVGPPTDFETYIGEVGASNDPERKAVSDQIQAVWGQSPEARAGFDPIKLIGSIGADVLLLREADDPLIPIEQIEHFVAARPTTQRVELEGVPGGTSDPSQVFLHGTLSDAGRGAYRAALGAFVDRAAESYTAERRAARTRCKGVTRTVRQAGTARVQSALRCLARTDASARKAGGARARTTIRSVRGEVNAARTWTALRANRTGQRVLAALADGRARTSVRSGDPSRVTLRVKH